MSSRVCAQTRTVGQAAFVELREQLERRLGLIRRLASAGSTELVEIAGANAFEVVVDYGPRGVFRRRYTPADSGFVSYCRITRELAQQALGSLT